MAYLADQQGPRARQVYIFKPTGAQYQFSGLDSGGYALRFLPNPMQTTIVVNGYTLAPEDWSGNNAGDTLTLARALGAGDVLMIVSESAYGIADAPRLSQNGADFPDKPAFLQNVGLQLLKPIEKTIPYSPASAIQFTIPAAANLIRFTGTFLPANIDSFPMALIREGGVWINTANAYILNYNIVYWQSGVGASHLKGASSNYNYMQVGYQTTQLVPCVFESIFTPGSSGRQSNIHTSFGAYSSTQGGISGTIGSIRTAAVMPDMISFQAASGNMLGGTVIMMECY